MAKFRATKMPRFGIYHGTNRDGLAGLWAGRVNGYRILNPKGNFKEVGAAVLLDLM